MQTNSYKQQQFYATRAVQNFTPFPVPSKHTHTHTHSGEVSRVITAQLLKGAANNWAVTRRYLSPNTGYSWCGTSFGMKLPFQLARHGPMHARPRSNRSPVPVTEPSVWVKVWRRRRHQGCQCCQISFECTVATRRTNG